MTALLLEDQADGSECWKRIPYMELAMNWVPNTTTKLSPYFIATGRDMMVPSPLFMKIPNDRQTVAASVRDMRRTQREIYETVIGNTEESIKTNKLYYDATAVKDETYYEVGDTVLYRDYRGHSMTPASFAGLYRPDVYSVRKRMGPNYLISSSDGKDERVVHFNQLRPYQAREQARTSTRNNDDSGKRKRLGFLPNDENDSEFNV